MFDIVSTGSVGGEPRVITVNISEDTEPLEFTAVTVTEYWVPLTSPEKVADMPSCVVGVASAPFNTKV
jgi:hypothetical protein